MAVNDEHGNLSGFCDAIDFLAGESDDDMFQFEANICNQDFNGPDIEFFANHFILDHQLFHYRMRIEYVGNVMWNCYHMKNSDALLLMKHIKKKKLFHPNCGKSAWWRWWEKLDDNTEKMFFFENI